MENNILSGLSFKRLTDNQIIKSFDCEDEDLNDFLFNKAIIYRKELLATTFIVESQERTLGYYSVLNYNLQLKEEDFISKTKYKKLLQDLLPYPKRHLKSLPSVKIGRLAIDKTFKGKGLGRIFINTIVSNCLRLNNEQACRLITVDAYRDALPFYERLNFEYLTEKDKDDDIRQMFLDLTTFDS